jgi:hypothetical protein
LATGVSRELRRDIDAGKSECTGSDGHRQERRHERGHVPHHEVQRFFKIIKFIIEDYFVQQKNIPTM